MKIENGGVNAPGIHGEADDQVLYAVKLIHELTKL